MGAKEGHPRQAREWSRRLEEVLPENLTGNADLWIAEGLAARETAVRWLNGAGILVADSEHEPERKGFFLGALQCCVPAVILQHEPLDLLSFPMHADKMFTWGGVFPASGGEPRGSRGAVQASRLPALGRP